MLLCKIFPAAFEEESEMQDPVQDESLRENAGIHMRDNFSWLCSPGVATVTAAADICFRGSYR